MIQLHINDDTLLDAVTAHPELFTAPTDLDFDQRLCWLHRLVATVGDVGTVSVSGFADPILNGSVALWSDLVGEPHRTPEGLLVGATTVEGGLRVVTHTEYEPTLPPEPLADTVHELCVFAFNALKRLVDPMNRELRSLCVSLGVS
ncbi:hypothetical protein [Nocardia transvalensis]|uniref:hypothetical protein n=1 Tax=Nocardia transvalensis TaxID=37333 RepID=UPI001895C4D2|nr:hypothetical protein [Nocardia transvalensis]MBF6332316.1 hypothetical protein [Nocardia transvalensis]